MGLGWELHELIQDFVDGKLSPERANEVQAFLDRHPIAQKVADQYREMTQPDPGVLAPPQSDSYLAERVMASIERAPWYALFKKPLVITALSLVVALPITLWLFDPLAIFGWVQEQVIEAFAQIETLKSAFGEVGKRFGTASPFLIASVLIAAFWGIVDRLIRLAHRTEQA